MLRFLRDNSKQGVLKYFFVMLLLLLIFSFMAWGIADVFRSWGTYKSAISVGKLGITSQELSYDLRDKLNSVSQKIGRPISLQEASKLGIVNGFVEQLIEKKLLENAISDLNINVSDNLVKDKLITFKEFQEPETGEFSKKLFRERLAGIGYQEEAFINEIKNSIVEKQLYSLLQLPEVKQANYSKMIYNNLNKKYSVAVYSIPIEAFSSDKKIPEEKLKQYYDKNKNNFVTAEQRSVKILSFDADKFKLRVKVSEQDINNYYNNNKDKYSTPETRSIKNASFKTKKEADEFYSKISKNEDFDKLANLQKIKVSSLKDVKRNAIPEAVADIVFKASSDRILAPFKTSYGWSIFWITKITPAHIKTVQEAKNDIVEVFRKQRVGELLNKTVENAEDAFGEGKNIDEVASQFNGKLVSIIDIKRDKLQDSLLKNNPKLVKAIFETDIDTSPFFDNYGQNYFAFVVTNIKEATAIPLEKVKDEIVKKIKIENKFQMAKEASIKLEKDLNNNNKDSTLYKRFPSKLYKYISVNSYAEDLDRVLQQKITESNLNEVIRYKADDSYLVAKVLTIQDVDNKEIVKEFDNINQKLYYMINNDILEQYKKSIRYEYPVKINEEAINSIFSG